MNQKKEAWTPLFALLAGIFTVVLLVSNVVAVKVIQTGPFILPGAIIIFPISYIFGDILTEVYGYERTRVVIWLGLAANFFAAAVFSVVEWLPPADIWPGQQAYQMILGTTPRIVVASALAYLSGEFLNSFVLSRLKVITTGRWLWLRTISSTLVGEGADTALFITLAFTGIIPAYVIKTMIISQWLVKVAYEVLATPVTYAVVYYVKHIEQVDVYDYHANYNPFHLRLEAKGND